MTRSFLLLIVLFSVSGVYAQSVRDFNNSTSPIAIVNDSHEAIYPDKPFELISTGYEDRARGVMVTHIDATYKIQYASKGVLYVLTLPDHTFNTFGDNTPEYTREQFVALPEVKALLDVYSSK